MSEELDLPDVDGAAEGYYKMSPSQIKLWLDGCKRKWGLRYIAKLYPEQDPNGPAAFGTAVHALLEKYQKDGIDWDYTTEQGKVAAKAKPFLPAPHPAALTEREFNWDTVRTGDSRPQSEGRAILWKGVIDLTLPTTLDVTLPEVIDYKTCRNLKYALDKDTLPVDPQAVIYAVATMAKYETTQANLMWLYLPRTGQARPVRVTLSWEHAKKEFRKLEVLAREIERTHALTDDAMMLPINAAVCDKYNGCPYKGTCNLGPIERQGILMGFLEDLAARRAAENGAAQGAAPEAKVVVTPSGNNTFSPEFLQAPSVTPAAPVQLINPPEAPTLNTYHLNGQAVQVPAAATAQQAAEAIASQVPEAVVVPQGQVAQGPQVVVAPPVSTLAVPAPPTKVTKPKKAKRTADEITADNQKALAESDARLAAQTAQTVVNGTLQTVDFVPQPASDRDIVVESSTPFTLYINCTPRWEHLLVEEYLANVKEAVNKAFNVDDYRAVDFAKGRAALANETAKAVKFDIENGRVKDLVIYTNTAESSDVLAALVALAGNRVVRA